MNTQIYPYNCETISSVNNFLRYYDNTSDYRFLFSSKEWLSAFTHVYNFTNNYLILSKNSHNYFSLSVINDEIVFTGDPFNDFNGVFVGNQEDEYDFNEIITYFTNLGYKLKFTNLFEDNLITKLKENCNGIIRDSHISLKINCHGHGQSYNQIVSNRVLKMYNKNGKNFVFSRIFGDETDKISLILDNLIYNRQSKFSTKKAHEYNLSFESKFYLFIRKLVSTKSISNNVFIDYCVDIKTNKITATSLNFIKDKHIICYLKSHIPSSNKISYGLILDYWSNDKNFQEGVKIIDLTRGNESYKYRLGATEYTLKDYFHN